MGLKRLIFDHVEKCGGKTVLKYLEAVYPKDEFHPLYSENQFDALHDLYGSYTPRCIAGHGAFYLIPMLREMGYETAVTLREPVQRVRSLYLFCKQLRYIPRNMSLKEFLRTVPQASNYYGWRFSGIPAGEVSHCPILVRDLAVEKISAFDYVGFTHNLSGFINSLDFLTPFRPSIENATTYEELIGPDDIALISQANKIDTEIYRIVSQLDIC